jgi:hypothetical protein
MKERGRERERGRKEGRHKVREITNLSSPYALATAPMSKLSVRNIKFNMFSLYA